MKLNFSFFLFSSLSLVSSLKSFSQFEDNNWYFGKYEALNFSNGTPTSINNSRINQPEGCSTISDAAGKLLFYTDGIKVWDRRNFEMPNGSGLGGNSSSTTSAYIVKKPLSDSLYYIFTVGAQAGQLGPYSGLRYSIVNIKANDGWGDVTEKNVFLEYKVSEKIVGVKHANNKDIWLIAEQFEYGIDSSKTNFFSFLITPDGIDTAKKVVSPPGYMIYVDASGANAIGQIKASPNGRKIAAAFAKEDYTLLYDFNNNTGRLTNAIKLVGNCSTCSMSSFTNNAGGMYGVEFSPDGKLLYTSAPGFDNGDFTYRKNIITQFRINFNSANAVINSKKLILSIVTSQVADRNIGQMQIAPNGKIYFAQRGNHLGAINDPNIYGKGCNATYNGLQLTSSVPFDIPTCIYGLPVVFKDKSGVLPLVLSQFSGNLHGNDVLLAWQTAIETNLNEYEIERSDNGTDFIKIGNVKNRGNSNTTQQYTYIDDHPLNGTNYYRLRIIDVDGKIFYSKIVLIELKESFNIVIYPNPVKKILNINGLVANSKTQLMISDMQDHILSSITTTNNSYSWNIQQLAAGTYFLKCEFNKKMIILRFLKE